MLRQALKRILIQMILSRASVTLQNGLEKVQPYYFMILADGIPVEFEINGSSYMSYALDLTAEQVTFDVKFKPEFSLNLGRLDFLLFFDGNPKSDHHMTTYTIQLRQVGWSDCQKVYKRRCCNGMA